MQQIYIPYCYFIGWTKESKYYYGVKYGRDANPSTFWVNYFTSSRYVRQMREKFGEPNIIKVRRTFKTSKEAINWEEKVIRRLNIVRSELWLNKNNNSNGTKCFSNEPKTQAQKDHQRLQMIGKKHTQETKDKISKGLKRYKRTREHQEKINKSKQGKKVPLLMNGKYDVCVECGLQTYHTAWQLEHNIKKNACSAVCSRAIKKKLKSN